MVLANQKTCPPSLFELITLTLITYLFFLLLFACSCLSSCWPVLAYCSPHPLPYPVCWLINIHDFVFSNFVLFFAPIVFLFSSSRQTENSPPRVLSPIVSFFTFYPTLHLPDFLQPACFSACLLLLRVSLCPCGTARVSLSV